MRKDLVLPQTFSKIDSDYRFFLECFREVLTEIDSEDLASVIPIPGEPDSSSQSVDPAREMHALSITFQLLNLVEENASAQTRRLRESSEGLAREPGLWGQNLKQLLKSGYTGEQISQAFQDIHVEPVLTAHPTEAKRPTVLQIHRSLYLLLVQLENQMWTPLERSEIKRQIKAQLERLHRTGEIFLTKPDVRSELENLLYYLREVFPGVLAKLDLRLRQSWIENGLDSALIELPESYPKLSFGNWVGGDRDGHPLVTADVTRKTLNILRENGLKVVMEQLHVLVERLSLSSSLQTPPPVLYENIQRIAAIYGSDAERVISRNPVEPWRQYVSLLIARMENHDRPGGYRRAGELQQDLAILRKSLIEVKAGRIAEVDVFPVERIVLVFGFHLAALDIRQNSSFHDRAIQQLLQAAGYTDHDFPNWPEEKRIAFLNEELKSPRPFSTKKTPLGTEANAVLECYRTLSDYYDEFGGDGLGSLIVSMTRNLSDLLAIYLLTREVGLSRLGTEGLECVLPVVPLFETIDDLKRAPGMLDAFIQHPVTQRSYRLQQRNVPLQQVMVGYSDSNKDGGYLASQWHLSCAQSALAETAERNGVNVCFFHGRGGTPSRGAGPTHRFLEALPHDSLMGHFRMTEQGETISQKYANAITATYNLELLLAGVTATTIRHGANAPIEPEYKQVMEQLTEYSIEAYQGLLATPGFIQFWASATPIDALEHSSIGSRPARRTGRRSLEDLRAIPWVFSWNQSRYFLPGWFGLGSALKRYQIEHPRQFDLLKDRIARWPILRNAIYNVETSHASADLDLMWDYAALVPDEEVRDRLYKQIADEYRSFESMIYMMFNKLRSDRRPRMIKTLRLRDPGLRRLHHHQVRLLREWRQAREENDEKAASALLPQVLLSVNAIAAGLRTTG